MSPTAQRYAKRAAAKDKEAANRGESTEGSSADESPRALTIRERGTKVSTPKRRQRAGSDDEYVLSPKGKGWEKSPRAEGSKTKPSPGRWGTHEKPLPRRASPATGRRRGKRRQRTRHQQGGCRRSAWP